MSHKPAATAQFASARAGESLAASSAIAELRRSGFKLTPQRLAIVRAFVEDPTHPTANDLFERLQPQLPTMSFATVYNTLGALADAGLCVARSFTQGPARFDPNVLPHDHAVCGGCGLVSDVQRAKDRSGESRRQVAIDAGFEVRAIEKVYRGLCAACARYRRDDLAAQSQDPEGGQRYEAEQQTVQVPTSGVNRQRSMRRGAVSPQTLARSRSVQKA